MSNTGQGRDRLPGCTPAPTVDMTSALQALDLAMQSDHTLLEEYKWLLNEYKHLTTYLMEERKNCTCRLK